MATVNKHLKILHLLSQRPDSTGSGIYVRAMIRESAALCWDNYLVAGVQSTGIPGGIDGLKQSNRSFVTFSGGDISFQIVGMSDVMPYDSHRFGDLSESQLDEYERAFSVRIRDAVDTFRPDIIHSNHLWLLSSLARRLFPGIPLVASSHGSDLRQFQNCPHLQERVLSGCRDIDAVLSLSRTQRDDIMRLYGFPAGKVSVTGAGYNDRLFYPVRKPKPKPVQIVYAGKLSKAKGVPWFLHALMAIESPGWRLHLVGGGSGEDRDLCLRLASALDEKVTVYGALPQDQAAEIIRQSHILALPSFYEGLPLVILEGLASGCRIVATDLPGTRELVGDITADSISLVPPPRLHRLDQPFPEDEQPFQRNLRRVLLKQIEQAALRPDVDLTPVQAKLDAYTWAGVFKTVGSVYLDSILRKEADSL